jgi:hypothetical protein
MDTPTNIAIRLMDSIWLTICFLLIFMSHVTFLQPDWSNILLFDFFSYLPIYWMWVIYCCFFVCHLLYSPFATVIDLVAPIRIASYPTQLRSAHNHSLQPK